MKSTLQDVTCLKSSANDVLLCWKIAFFVAKYMNGLERKRIVLKD